MAFGYYHSEDDEKKKAFQTLCAEVARSVVPCAPSLNQMKAYLTDTLGMEQVSMTKGELRSRNGQFVEKYCSELLSTPLVVLPADRVPTSQEMTEMMHQQTKRFKEAMSISLDQTGFVFTKYSKSIMMEDRKIADIEVIVEDSLFGYVVEAQGNGIDDAESLQIRYFIDDIVLFRGVTEKDILTESRDYQSYVATMAGRIREGQ